MSGLSDRDITGSDYQQVGGYMWAVTVYVYCFVYVHVTILFNTEQFYEKTQFPEQTH